jgi:hypothetical protein
MIFSLPDKNDSESLLKALHLCISKDGFIFIQTLHADAVTDNETCGWKEAAGMDSKEVLQNRVIGISVLWMIGIACLPEQD